jgi:hypothetical protein
VFCACVSPWEPSGPTVEPASRQRYDLTEVHGGTRGLVGEAHKRDIDAPGCGGGMSKWSPFPGGLETPWRKAG